jgi:acyl-coenzyme A synthetase/AMP-(fatty) acid ligase/thioesterase domain-containing protein
VTPPSPLLVATDLVRRAAAEPIRIAARDERRAVTFAELDALAGTLATTLLEHRAELGPDAYLPVVCGRDVESVIAMHAAMRAGLPFAPLDASSPPAMLAELLARTGDPRIAVVTRPEQAALLPAVVTVLEVPTGPGVATAPQPVCLEGPGAVLFTSGSTGRPKGVLLDWDGIDNGVTVRRGDHPDQDPRGSVLITSPFTFLGGFYWVTNMCTGPSLSIADPTAVDPVGLLERIDRERITVVSVVPSLAATIVGRWPDGRRLDSVRVVNTFGEALDWEQVPGLRALFSTDAVIASKYGASEGLSEIFRLTITPTTALGTGPVPLGTPVEPGRVRLQPVGDDPDGPRELAFLGRLARGYLGDPELTAAKFDQDADGTRVFRSGDVATVDADGVYHRIGRLDDLVKIRGKLVEPSEAQRVLRTIPGITTAVVLPQPGPAGAMMLVGHLVLDDGTDLTPRDVRRLLSQEIAPHLVPSLLVRHDGLPVNRHGKTDRQALVGAEPVPWLSSTPRPPANEEERFASSAAGIVLGRADVTPDDDLWELGLDSLSAVELTLLLEEAGWERLEPAVLLDHRSPAALARLHAAGSRPSQAVWLNRDGSRPPLFCIPGAGGTAMAYRWVASEFGPDQPLLVVEPRGLHTPGRPDFTVAQAASRALEHIEPHLDDRPVTLVGYSGGGVVAYEMAGRLAGQGRSVRVLLLDAASSEALRREPGAATRTTVRRAALQAWLRAFPARTVPREQRYRAYFHIGGRAVQRYSVPPADFPVVVFHPDGSALAPHWRGVGADVDLVEVGGDHYTMLEPPHARGLVAAMRSALEGTGPA